MRNHGVIVEDKPRQHGGMANIQVEGYVIPIIQTEGLPAIKIRKPTEKELEECIHVEITRDEPWSPHDINEDDITEEQYNNYWTVLLNAKQEVYMSEKQGLIKLIGRYVTNIY